MTLVLALAVRLLLATDGSCYFVGNTRILVLPSCDIGPATIAELTEEPTPPTAAGLIQARRHALRAYPGRGGAVPAQAAVMVRGDQELERRLVREQQRRIDEVRRRLEAEHERDLARRQREVAERRLDEARQALSTATERLRRAGRAEPRGRADQPRS